MSEKLTYEHFVRGAFQFALEREIDRWGDPATLANTDYFEDHLLPRVKAAVSYSMEIYNGHIREESISESDYDLMDQILASVVNAPDTRAISKLIQQYKTSIRSKYITE
ncbi:hypothetical protein JOC78_000799 [Bacillus ectoiniformans]|uniref:hypothetical protein n=1 Tax=Bacillus ectoiniformans TaxID=1494429 RepID=UPI00195F0127|nr:hypothetical protein [Bacillus ectoiniformans]MBM7647859.1 hypothetical protein [Bacillus ectoiniformans]